MKNLLFPLLVITLFACEEQTETTDPTTDVPTEQNDSTSTTHEFVHQQHNASPISESTAKGSFHGILRASDDFEILGWFPNWEDGLAQKIDYQALSTIAYFAYVVDPSTGKAKSTYDWDSTPMLDSAKVNNNKVLLTVANFGGADNATLLKNTDAQTTLINEIKDVLSGKWAKGVCLDFEGVENAQKAAYATFVKNLKQALLDVDKDYEIYITVPVVNWDNSLDFESLNASVDRYVIMGYGFYTGSSKTAGPTDLLHSGDVWETYNLANSVEYYLAQGVPSKQLMLALPFYGTVWETESAEIGATAIKYIGTKTFDYINSITQGAEVKYDSTSANVWCAIKDTTQPGKYIQYYFDDKRSIETKIDFMKSKGLAGMGVWALGYW